MKPSYNLPALRFVGHGGEITKLKSAAQRAMFIPDANLVLSLLQHGSNYAALPDAYRSYLITTRSRVRRHWHDRVKWIPVNPTYAAMELSSQDLMPDRAKFDSYFAQFLSSVYQIDNVDPRWIGDCFYYAQRLSGSFLPSFKSIFAKALELMPAGGSRANDTQVEDAVNAMCDWLEARADDLAVIGGLPLYVTIYAFAGSPQARRLLKVERSQSRGIDSTARNVAWDFMYCLHREFSYLRHQYDDDIFCTGDEALAELLSSKINRGPRYSRGVAERLDSFESFGDLSTFPLRRLDGQTRLTKRLEERVLTLLVRASMSKGTIPVGFPPLRRLGSP